MADSQKKHTQTCSYRRETCRVTTFLLICQESKSRRPGLSFCWKTNDTNPAVNVIDRFGLGFFFFPPLDQSGLAYGIFQGTCVRFFLKCTFYLHVCVASERRRAAACCRGDYRWKPSSRLDVRSAHLCLTAVNKGRAKYINTQLYARAFDPFASGELSIHL